MNRKGLILGQNRENSVFNRFLSRSKRAILIKNIVFSKREKSLLFQRVELIFFLPKTKTVAHLDVQPFSVIDTKSVFLPS